jgi:hypothetical protein
MRPYQGVSERYSRRKSYQRNLVHADQMFFPGDRLEKDLKQSRFSEALILCFGSDNRNNRQLTCFTA